jgi:periplasmic copper chaperone A
MKTIILTAVCVAAGLIAGTVTVSAHEHGKKKEMSGHHAMSSSVKVENAWARATPGLAKNGGAYFTAVNGGKTADRIIGVASNVSSRTELHTHLNDNGVMRMREVKDGVEVPAGGTVTFKPGGLHIMFIGLHKPLKKGTSFPVTLMFEKAGKQTVDVTVQGVGAMGGTMKGGMKHDMRPGMKHDMKPMQGGHHGK